jgi:hypothetical protein
LTLSQIVAPDSELDSAVDRAWRSAFPTSQLVGAAVGLLPAIASQLHEGPSWFVGVSAGTVSVRRRDLAKRERAHEVEHDGYAHRTRARLGAADLLAGRDPARKRRGTAVIAQWSPRSRSRMVQTIQEADWTAMLGDGSVPPVAVTLTYPGDWLAVAPHADAARRHLLLWRKRFEREYGCRLRAVWKREFQARGAPHYHLLMMAPAGVQRSSFRAWVSASWAAVVDSESCGRVEPVRDRRWMVVCCERHRHEVAGTSVDFTIGGKMRDPRRVGVYFAKHGSFSAKEYQNRAPAEWVEHGSIGRFWGLWGLPSTRHEVEVPPDAGVAAARTLRRLSRANSYLARVPVWRYRTRVAEDGTVTAKWRRATALRRVYRVKHGAGFLAVNDGPAVAAQLARHVCEVGAGPLVGVPPAGLGPRGFLP